MSWAGIALWALMPTLQAATLESHYLQTLTKARSGAEVARIQAAYERVSILRTACRIQRRERAVPAACYEEIHLERELGLKVARGEDEKLDVQCANASQQRRLNSALNAFVSPFCLSKVRAAQEIEAYRQEEDWGAIE